MKKHDDNASIAYHSNVIIQAYPHDFLKLLEATAYHFEAKDDLKNRGLESITY